MDNWGAISELGSPMLVVVLLGSLGAFLSVFSTSMLIATGVFVLFSWLRLRNARLYMPRATLLKIDHAPPQPPPTLFGWVISVWHLTEEEILHTAGLDVLIYLRFARFCMRLFAVFCFFAAVLLPLNRLGGNHVSNVEAYSMANIQKGSDLMWAHVVCAWIFSGVTYYMLYREYDENMKLTQRFHDFRSAHLYTVMVMSVPEDHRSDRDLANFFEALYPGQVHCAYITRDCRKLREMVDEVKEQRRMLSIAREQFKMSGKRPSHRPLDKVLAYARKHVLEHSSEVRMMGAGLVDSIDYFLERIHSLTADIESGRAKVYPPHSEGFVSFKSSRTAAIAAQVWHINDGWETRLAPLQRDVLWRNMGINPHQKRVRRIVIAGGIAWLVLFWTIPVTLCATLTTLNRLEDSLPFLTPVLNSSKILKAFLTGFLPTVALTAFMGLLPSIVRRLSMHEMPHTKSELDSAVLVRLYYFYVINTFFVTTLAGTIMDSIHEIVRDPGSTMGLLGESLPKQAVFFINYVVLNGLAGFPGELLRLGQFIRSFFVARLLTSSSLERAESEDPGEIPFAEIYANQLLILTLCIAYSIIAPLILPFALGYYVMNYVTWAYQLVFVYKKRYESGALLWPLVFGRLIVALIISQLTLMGVLSLKLGIKQGPFLIPLPFISAAFYYYCMSKFSKANTLMPLKAAIRIDDEAREHARQGVRSVRSGRSARRGHETRERNKSAQPGRDVSVNLKFLEQAYVDPVLSGVGDDFDEYLPDLFKIGMTNASMVWTRIRQGNSHLTAIMRSLYHY